MPHLQVGQLQEYFAKRQERSETAKLGDFAVSDDATELRITQGVGTSAFPLDETATTALAKYLKIPARYLNNVEPDFRAVLLRYEFERHQEAATTVEAVNDTIIAVHQPTQLMIPQSRVTQVIGRVFSPEDTVRRIATSENLLHIDITTERHQVSFPHQDLVAGDITEGGIRFLAHPFRSTAPSVSPYVERLICSNGVSVDERIGRISLTGHTVDEVIEEMERAAQLTLGQLDDHLERLSATRQIPVPGSPQAFAAQLAKEANVTRKVLDRVLEEINQLPQPVSVWDVQNVLTSVANESTKYTTLVKLQNLGGDLAFDAERSVSRCAQCERKL